MASKQKKTKLTTLERLQRSRVQMLLKMPFLGQIAMQLKLVEDKSIKTAATNGKEYLYNPEFVDKLKEKELNFLTAHEVFHVLLGHMWRGVFNNKLDNELMNIAEDFVINSMIHDMDPQEELFKMPKKVCFDKQYRRMNCEDVFKLLREDDDFVKMVQRKLVKGITITIDVHPVPGDLPSGSVPTEQEVAGIVAKAKQGTSTGATANGEVGGATGEIAELPQSVKDLIEQILRPQKNWRQILKEFIQPDVSDYGFTPPDKRLHYYDFVLPAWTEPEDTLRNIVVAVDTSGSVNVDLVKIFLREVVDCIYQFGGIVTGKLIFCSHTIPENGVHDLQDALSAQIPVGGGTNFRPVFEWVETNMKNDCSGVIYFTDGQGKFPEQEPPYPLLWVLSGASHKVVSRIPFGRIIHI